MQCGHQEQVVVWDSISFLCYVNHYRTPAFGLFLPIRFVNNWISGSFGKLRFYVLQIPVSDAVMKAVGRKVAKQKRYICQT